jgi:hypothetical protein
LSIRRRGELNFYWEKQNAGNKSSREIRLCAESCGPMRRRRRSFRTRLGAVRLKRAACFCKCAGLRWPESGIRHLSPRRAGQAAVSFNGSPPLSGSRWAHACPIAGHGPRRVVPRRAAPVVSLVGDGGLFCMVLRNIVIFVTAECRPIKRRSFP